VISKLELGASDFAVLEAVLHKGPLPVNEIGKKVQLTSGSITLPTWNGLRLLL
jgi:MarR family 2-MHQ and catechol resistance regulon transcriptional repressor